MRSEDSAFPVMKSAVMGTDPARRITMPCMGWCALRNWMATNATSTSAPNPSRTRVNRSYQFAHSRRRAERSWLCRCLISLWTIAIRVSIALPGSGCSFAIRSQTSSVCNHDWVSDERRRSATGFPSVLRAVGPQGPGQRQSVRPRSRSVDVPLRRAGSSSMCSLSESIFPTRSTL